MKLTDFVVDFLVDQGVNTIFGLTGGAVVHLFDSVDQHPDAEAVFCHHEQAAALAAVSYSRARNCLGAAFVTTGPGGTNAVTGVTAAWLDSIPCVFVSGQTRLRHTSHGKPIRQLGTQELDIVPIVQPITKYAVMIDDALSICYELEKAIYLAREGRPGPVWIDIPLDFQWAEVDPDTLQHFVPPSTACESLPVETLRECKELLCQAERPLVLVGYGVRLAEAHKEIIEFVEKYQLPFVTSWTASDMVFDSHPLYMGRPGFAGQRGANLAVQNSDLLLCIGSHLSVPLTGTLFDAFAREAKVVMVDIDEAELDHQTVHVDLPVLCDSKLFLHEMVQGSPLTLSCGRSWLHEYCPRYKAHNAIPSEWRSDSDVNSYVFVDTLSDMLDGDECIVVDGGGTVVYSAFQAFKVKQGQRLFLSSGLCAMGTGLPESIGAWFADKTRKVICLCGDGSLPLNVQELQTMWHHNMNVKVFVFNNHGYLAIRHTQAGFLGHRYVGSSSAGGMSLPDCKKIANAYGVDAREINSQELLSEQIAGVLDLSGPVVCDVVLRDDQEMIPCQGFDKKPDGTGVPRPLEDMKPYLDRSEFFQNMIVSPWPSSKGGD